jgi:uncharacterized protein YaiL (DUF2058 family)
MFNALKDQLIKAGLAPVETERPKAPERKNDPRRGDTRRGDTRNSSAAGAGNGQNRAHPASRPSAPGRTASNAPRPANKASGEPDLRIAFAQRERAEQAEREAQRRAAEEESRLRKAQRAQLKHLLGQHTALNDAAAEIARNFLWGRKIRRTYVTAEQLKAVNAGELGIVAMDGRFSVYPSDVVRAVQLIDKHAVGLLVDPNAPVDEPDYDDPRYQVPDDLVW